MLRHLANNRSFLGSLLATTTISFMLYFHGGRLQRMSCRRGRRSDWWRTVQARFTGASCAVLVIYIELPAELLQIFSHASYIWHHALPKNIANDIEYYTIVKSIFTLDALCTKHLNVVFPISITHLHMRSFIPFEIQRNQWSWFVNIAQMSLHLSRCWNVFPCIRTICRLVDSQYKGGLYIVVSRWS